VEGLHADGSNGVCHRGLRARLRVHAVGGQGDTILFDEFANIGDDTNVTGEEEYGVPHHEP
jgi:hypothetical protein